VLKARIRDDLRAAQSSTASTTGEFRSSTPPRSVEKCGNQVTAGSRPVPHRRFTVGHIVRHGVMTTADVLPAPLFDDNPAVEDLLGFTGVADARRPGLDRRRTRPVTVGVQGAWAAAKSTVPNLVAQRLESVGPCSSSGWARRSSTTAKTSGGR
jgi:hypothetical protein